MLVTEVNDAYRKSGIRNTPSESVQVRQLKEEAAVRAEIIPGSGLEFGSIPSAPIDQVPITGVSDRPRHRFIGREKVQ